ncbi:MBOAT family O-acyltransferase [Silvibacterium dinghuense]|nr:MBOAT family protein [Silvibacterium dinghuense]GGH06659.1 alginate O-acetyltransferase [Silvibacterium dinghuense]
MSLSSSVFFVFFLVICGLYWLLARHRSFQIVLLLLANLAFLAKFGPVYLLVPVAASIDWAVGLGLTRTGSQTTRRILVILSLLLNIGLLLGQKLIPLAPHFRWGWLFHLSLSFYCFQALSYTIDLYRGEGKAEANLLRYWAGAMFFPVIVAGPIPRMHKLLKQLREPFRLTQPAAATAFLLIATGLVKKLLVADYLANNFVNRVFDTPALYSGFENLLAVYGYALQLFFDFSGYTDIAMGVAMLLGLSIPENFRTPYLSVNLQDFWKRWHISFSSWLTDYLFESLPKSRLFPSVTYAYAFMVTFLLGGLWHGITWNFLIWGAIHGTGLWLFYLWSVWRKKRGAKRVGSLPGRIAGALLTFHFVCFSWIFFRAADLPGAIVVLKQIGSHTWGMENVTLPVAGVLVFAVLAHCIPQDWFDRSAKLADAMPFWAQGVALAGIVIAIEFLAGQGSAGFVYGKF